MYKVRMRRDCIFGDYKKGDIVNVFTESDLPNLKDFKTFEKLNILGVRVDPDYKQPDRRSDGNGYVIVFEHHCDIMHEGICHDDLDIKISDFYGSEVKNSQTFREFIMESEKEFDMWDKDSNKRLMEMTIEQLNEHLEFLDYLCSK